MSASVGTATLRFRGASAVLDAGIVNSLLSAAGGRREEGLPRPRVTPVPADDPWHGSEDLAGRCPHRVREWDRSSATGHARTEPHWRPATQGHNFHVRTAGARQPTFGQRQRPGAWPTGPTAKWRASIGAGQPAGCLDDTWRPTRRGQGETLTRARDLDETSSMAAFDLRRFDDPKESVRERVAAASKADRATRNPAAHAPTRRPAPPQPTPSPEESRPDRTENTVPPAEAHGMAQGTGAAGAPLAHP